MGPDRLSKGARAGAALAAVGLALAAGCGGVAESQQGTVTVTVNASAPPPARAGTTGTPGTEPAAVSTQSAAAPDGTATNSAPAALDEAQFWQLIAETRHDAGNDTGRQSDLLKDRLTQLSPAHREVLNETILRDRTVNEAAAVLGVPVGTVKSRVYYALRALRLVLAERGVTV